MSVGVAMQSGPSDNKTHDQFGLENEGVENQYHLLSTEAEDEDRQWKREKNYLSGKEKEKEKGSKGNRDKDAENHYHLLSNAEVKKKEKINENVYHVLERPGDDDDYEDPDETERENVYHVLEGPTPVREEEEEEEREEQEDEPEPTAYEVPVTTGTNNSSTL